MQYTSVLNRRQCLSKAKQGPLVVAVKIHKGGAQKVLGFNPPGGNRGKSYNDPTHCNLQGLHAMNATVSAQLASQTRTAAVTVPSVDAELHRAAGC